MKGRRVKRKNPALQRISRFLRRYGRLLVVLWFAVMIVVAGVYLVRAFKNIGKPQLGNKKPGVVATPMPSPTPDLRWMQGIRTAPKEPINLTWIYRPRTYTGTPKGVNVLSPTWFEVEDVDGKSAVRAKVKEEDIKAYVEGAHADGTKVWGTIVSHTPALSDALIHTQEYREAFFKTVADYVKSYKLDGICMDFEQMNPEHKQDYTEFVRDLRAALPSGTVMSVAVTIKLENPSPDNWWQCYDHAELSKVSDYLAVMTYDQNGSSSPEGGPVAATWWTEGSIRILLRDIPSDKLLLGLPFYGRDYRYEADSAGDWQPIWPINKKRGTSPVYQRDIDAMISSGEYTDVLDQSFGVKIWQEKSGYESREGSRFIEFIDTEDVLHRVWYDDMSTLYDKAQLARTYRLAGVAVWEASYASPIQWDTVHKAMTDPAPDMPKQ